MPDHAVLYNRSPISDRRVNNNYKLSHAGIYVAAIIGMIEVRLHYDDCRSHRDFTSIPLHSVYLYRHISPISEGRKGPLGQLTTHILCQPVTIPIMLDVMTNDTR